MTDKFMSKSSGLDELNIIVEICGKNDKFLRIVSNELEFLDLFPFLD